MKTKTSDQTPKGGSLRKARKARKGIALLKRVRDEGILAHPRQFQMDCFFAPHDSVGEPADGCNTAACIAAWTIHFDQGRETLGETQTLIEPQYNNRIVSRMRRAKNALGISSEKASMLFLLEQWPDHYRKRWNAAQSAKTRARVAADRINHFIKTHR